MFVIIIKKKNVVHYKNVKPDTFLRTNYLFMNYNFLYCLEIESNRLSFSLDLSPIFLVVGASYKASHEASFESVFTD